MIPETTAGKALLASWTFGAGENIPRESWDSWTDHIDAAIARRLGGSE